MGFSMRAYPEPSGAHRSASEQNRSRSAILVSNMEITASGAHPKVMLPGFPRLLPVTGVRRHGERFRQLKLQQGFRRQLNLLPLSQSLNPGPGGSRGSSDGGALTSADQAPITAK